MNRRLLVFCCAILVCCAAPAWADIEVIFDMDPLTDAIESHRTVNPGDEFDVGIVLMLKEPSKMNSYLFSVRFDTDELDYVTRDESPPANWFYNSGNDGIEDPAGRDFGPLGPVNYGLLTGFDGLSFIDVNAPMMHTAATVTFKSVGPAGSDSDIDMIAGLFAGLGPGFEGFQDSSQQQIDATFRGGSVTVVPEPGSLTLIGVALFCLGGWRFRRRRGQ